MKIAKLSLATIIALGSTAFAADSLATMFKDGKVSGEIRSMYINNDMGAVAPAVDGEGFAVGGNIKFETASYMGIKLGTALYTAQGLGGNNVAELAGTNSNLLDTNGNSYSLLGQAYIQYNHSNTMLKVGRQQLNTPLIDADDMRIVPDLFEAYALTNTDIADTTLFLAHITQMAGTIDTWAVNGHDFESMSDSAGLTVNGKDEGVTVASAVYEGFQDTTLQAWYYTLSGDLDIWYLEADYSWNCRVIDGMEMYGAIQYVNFDADNSLVAGGFDYDIWGAMIEGAHTSGFGFDLAYNNYSDDTTVGATTGQFSGIWGGYPEFAVADEYWANSGAVTANTDAWRIGASYDFAKSGVDGLSASVAYVAFDNDTANTDVDVIDFIVNYDVQAIANLSTYVVYEDVSRDTAAGVDSDIFKLYVGYTF